jgi:hypothetical protein
MPGYYDKRPVNSFLAKREVLSEWFEKPPFPVNPNIMGTSTKTSGTEKLIKGFWLRESMISVSSRASICNLKQPNGRIIISVIFYWKRERNVYKSSKSLPVIYKNIHR